MTSRVKLIKIIIFGIFLQAWKDSIRKGWTEIEEDYRFS